MYFKIMEKIKEQLNIQGPPQSIELTRGPPKLVQHFRL